MATTEEFTAAMNAAGITPEGLQAFLEQAQETMGYVAAISGSGLTPEQFGGFMTGAKLRMELNAMQSLMNVVGAEERNAADTFRTQREALEAAMSAKQGEIDAFEAAAAGQVG